MSSPREFKARTRKIVTLPSGLTVEIRKLKLIDFLGMEIPLPSDPQASSAPSNAMSLRETQQYANRAIIAAAISPRFTDDDNEAERDDRVHVRDLEMMDWEALVKEIFDWSGLAREVVAEANSFRKDEVGENHSEPGGSVSQASDGAARNDTR